MSEAQNVAPAQTVANNPFDYTADDIGGSAGFVDDPYIGKARLTGLETADRPGRQEGEVYDSLSTTWQLLDQPKKGMRFAATEYAPDPAIPSYQEVEANPDKAIEIAGNMTTVGEAFTRVVNQWKRIAHLLHPYFGKAEAAALTQRHQPITITPKEAWDSLRAEIGELFEGLSADVKNQEVTIKVVANFFGTKPKLSFPAYAGFVSQDTPLTFSQSERGDNAKWAKYKTATPSDAPSNGNGSSNGAVQKANF